jgi:hypothetical protein
VSAVPAYHLANLDRPSWRWSPRDWRVFRAYCRPTRRQAELAPYVVSAYRSGTSAAEIAVRGEISRAYVYELLAAEAHRDRIVMDRFHAARRNLGRPIDLGGPRDVWVDYDIDEQE